GLPKGEEWERMRMLQLKEMEQVYKLSKLAYQAYLSQKPQGLESFENPDTCTSYYARAIIIGGDSLLNAWKHLTQLQAEQNVSPKQVWKEYHQALNSKHKYEYAKLQVLSFGWWNCAIRLIEGFDEKKAYLIYERLFDNIKELNCDEP
ncbi:MAG: hypothetical protein ACRCZZ_08745, partial [Phocaeicola sp.]